MTRSRVSDIAGMRTMLDRFGPCLDTDGNADFCLDSAYLARELCNRLTGMGFAPYIKPKKNTLHNARGSQSWRVMVKLYNDNLSEFKRHYHQRREMAARIMCYNIEMSARHDVRSGRLARQSLEAVVA